MIDLNEEARGQLEPKHWKVNQVLVVEIQQPGSSSLSLFQDLISILQEHVTEQQKQTRLLARLVCVQELDHADWVQAGTGDLEMGSEESEGTEMEWDEAWNRSPLKDKGKGKEKERQSGAEDGGGSGNGNGNGDANSKVEMLQ